jgi:ATP-binding cassette subfamily B protein
VIENATATVEKGSIVCVTGQSGSGKSTLFKLLLRVYEPTEGEMLAVVGKENVPLSCDTRNLFAYVPQGNFLFSGTIYDNVVFFAENPTDDDVENALKAACAEFVYDLPDGLQTPLLERGGGLSEGQMQRLAIARALLSNRPVLLFDEATSALDGETEKRLLQNVKAMQNKTCILVTHRPAALAIADRILDVQDGKVHIVK